MELSITNKSKLEIFVSIFQILKIIENYFFQNYYIT